MFCNNCGSKLPDGSKFCSVCGTRLVDLEPVVTEAKSAGSFGYAADVRTDADRSESYENVATRVSFDWSNVIEEPIKKVVPEIRSPWVEPVVEERPAVEKPSLDHRRTMSFIEILKQEREEKLKAAELEAQAATTRQEAVPDYTEFENAPQMYSGVDKIEESPMFEEPMFEEPMAEKPEDEPVIDEPVIDEPVIDETVIDEPVIEAPVFKEPIFEEPAVEKPEYIGRPFDLETADLTDVEPSLHTIAEETISADPLFETSNIFEETEEPVVATSPVEEEAPIDFGDTHGIEDFYSQTLDFGAAEPSNLEAELDAILNAGAGRISRVERNASADFTEEVEEDEEVIDDFTPETIGVSDELLDSEEIELTMPIEEFAETETPAVEELGYDDSSLAPVDTTEEIEDVSEYEPPLYDEVPSLEDVLAADAAQPYDTAKATIVPVAEEESEIEELKRRLSVLMHDEPAEANGKPVAPDFDVADGAIEDEFDEVAVETEDEEVGGVISLDELEKELFGDDLPEDSETEATKKIDKFYTLYKKNEEFQKLLEEEYDKLKEADENQEKESIAEEVAVAVEEIEAPASTPIAVPVPATVTEEKADGKIDKAAAKKAKKEAKKAKKKDVDDEPGGSGVLTVFAVIIAVLLVVLLGVILVLNFAPDSGIAMTIDSVIENIASYFSDAGMIDNISLL